MNFSRNTINLSGKLISVDTPVIMGIINTTSDSFYGQSRSQSIENTVAMAAKHITEGAIIIDIGAYSTRPGAKEVSLQEETDTLCVHIEAIKKSMPEALILADTFRAKVAKAAIQAGANMINDVQGGCQDTDMYGIIASEGVPYILMHGRGTPATMQSMTEYEDVVAEIFDFFALKINELTRLGIKDIIIDPGFGFAKNVEQNYTLLTHLADFEHLNVPILAGISRKSMIYKPLNATPEAALNGTTALHMLALTNGANILRVHDVKAAKEAIDLYKIYNDAL